MELSNRDVLVVVDMQNDFCEGGALPTADGHQVVPVINQVGQKFQNVVLTQDWHPEGHVSFASAHPGKQPLETVKMPYGDQILWPDHVVQNSWGAEFHPDLDLPHAQLVIRKGYLKDVDSYSAFCMVDGETKPDWRATLRSVTSSAFSLPAVRSITASADWRPMRSKPDLIHTSSTMRPRQSIRPRTLRQTGRGARSERRA